MMPSFSIVFAIFVVLAVAKPLPNANANINSVTATKIASSSSGTTLPTTERAAWIYCRKYPKWCCKIYPNYYKCKPYPSPEPWVYRGVDTALDNDEAVLSTTSRTALMPKKSDSILPTSERGVRRYCWKYPSLCCKKYPNWYRCSPLSTPEPWVSRGVDAALDNAQASITTTSRTDANLPTVERSARDYCRRWPKWCCKKYPNWYTCVPLSTPEPWVSRGVDAALEQAKPVSVSEKIKPVVRKQGFADLLDEDEN